MTKAKCNGNHSKLALKNVSEYTIIFQMLVHYIRDKEFPKVTSLIEPVCLCWQCI